MAGRPLAEAFVRVRADPSGVRKDIRNEFTQAGTDGGKAFGDSFNRDASGRLRDARGRFVRELGDAGGDGGRNAGDRFSTAFGDAFRRLGPLLTRAFGGANVGLRTLTRGAVTAAKAIAGVALAASALNTVMQASASAAPLAGLLLLLPAAAVSAAAGIGTLRIATSGLADAFKLAMTPGTGPKKLAESMKNLSPAARSVALELNKLRPMLLDLRNTVQQALLQPLIGQLTATARALSGPVKVGAAAVAAQFGQAGKQIGEFVRQSATIQLVQEAFLAVRQSVGNLSRALQPVLAGLRAISLEGLSFLPGISSSVANVATRFGTWLQQIVKSGQAFRWISNALATLKQFGGVLSNIGGILKSVFSAASASGTGFLGVIGAALSQLNAFLKTAAGKSALQSIFQGLGQIGTSLAPVIAALVQGLGMLAAPLGRLAQLVGPILATAISALAPALAALEPGLKALFGALGQAVGILAPVLPAIAQAISDVAVAIAPVLPLAAGLAKVVAQVLVAALKVLIPVIQPIIAAFTSSLLPVLPQLSKAVTDLVLAFVPLAAALGPAFAKTITDLAPQFASIATQFLTGLLPAVTQFVAAITPFIPDLVRLSAEFGYLAVRVLPSLMPLLITLATVSLDLTTNMLQLLPHVSGLVGALASIFSIAGVVGVLSNVSGAVSTVGNFIIGLPGKILGALNWVIKNVPAAFSSAFKGAYNATTSIGSTVLGWIGKMPGAIVKGFSGAGKWLVGAGKDIVVGLWNGIASLGNWIYRQIMAFVRAVIPAPVRKVLHINSPSRVMAELGQYAGQGLAVGLDASRTGVTRAASRLANAAVPAARTNGLTVAMAGAGGGSTGLSTADVAAAVKAAVDGIAVHMDGRPVGEIVSRRLGQSTAQRRRTG